LATKPPDSQKYQNISKTTSTWAIALASKLTLILAVLAVAPLVQDWWFATIRAVCFAASRLE
jgi:hypothetical protein